MTEHEINESCRARHDRADKHIDDMVNPKDGVIAVIKVNFHKSISRLHDKCDTKVSLRMFQWIVGVTITLVLMFTGGAVRYTYSEAEKNALEHRTHATIAQMEKDDNELKQEIQGVEDKVDALDEKLDHVKDEIIKAINKR